ncbi:MAG: hypothetical protein GXP55_06165 [Deltaproteobacteria bacterium]|nr:hypothetical protein [Deltaproteobacteria bacterium]
MRTTARSFTWLLLLALAACGDDAAPADAGSDAAVDSSVDGGSDTGVDGAPLADAAVDPAVDSSTDAGPMDAGVACPRAAPTGDGAHAVVVSHPFDAAGTQDTRFELLELSASGELSATGTSFRMGRAFSGEIIFTPDGELGFVAQEDGSVGVFRLDAAGVTVLDTGFSGDFYAERVVMDPGGDRLWIVDAEFPNIGGGLYIASIGCDGSLGVPERVLTAKLPYDVAFLGDGRALVSAREVAGAAAGDDASLFDLSAGATRLSSVDAFGDENAIVSDVVVTDDGAFGLLADNCGFCGTNRVGVVSIEGDTLSVQPKLSPIEDPVALVPSPFDDLLLVVSGFGNAVLVYDRADPPASPFALRGELTYVGAAPQLPGAAQRVDRGSLRGLVLLAENLGVRRLRFMGASVVDDLGLMALGTGTESVVGAMGVTP